jgi:hypothetical protein
MLRPNDGSAAHRREPSLVCSRYVGHHNAHPTQGIRHPRPDWVVKDQLHYGDNDLDNHGQHSRVRDARRSLSLNACGPHALQKGSSDAILGAEKACSQTLSSTLGTSTLPCGWKTFALPLKQARRTMTSSSSNTCRSIMDADVIRAFLSGTTNEALVHELRRCKA